MKITFNSDLIPKAKMLSTLSFGQTFVMHQDNGVHKIGILVGHKKDNTFEVQLSDFFGSDIFTSVELHGDTFVIPVHLKAVEVSPCFVEKD